MDAALVLEELAEPVRRHWGAGAEPIAATTLTGGASAVSWRVQVRTAGGDEMPFLLRHDPPARATAIVGGQDSGSAQRGDGARGNGEARHGNDAQGGGGGLSTLGGVGRDGEWRLLQAARQGGVRVAGPLFQLPQGCALGQGYAQQWIEGEAVAPRILKNPDFAPARARFARQCGEQLAHIHALDRTAGALLPELEQLAPEDALQRMEQVYRASGMALPVFEAAFAWLRAHPLPIKGRGVVHGDFRLGNLMLDADGLAAVLDWELAHRGEILQDFGWLCVNSWRFGNRDLPVGGCGQIEDLIAGYEEAGGTKGILPADVLAWTLQGSLRWGVICINQGLRGLSREHPSLEHLAIGRRVSETEADLVWTLAQLQGAPLPPVPPPPEVKPDAPPLLGHPDLPSAAQLEAVLQGYLQRLAAEVPPPHGFYLRVARNVVGALAREMQQGPGFRAVSARRMAALLPAQGNPDRRALAAAIRDGELSPDNPELLQALWLEAMGKLGIDNPRYSTWRDGAGGYRPDAG